MNMKAIVENATYEERVMNEFEDALSDSQAVIIDGRTFYPKAEVFSRLSCSKPSAYKWFSMVSRFFEHAKSGTTMFIRLDESINWRAELMSGSVSVEDYSMLALWDRVSNVMRNSIEMTCMMHGIEDFLSSNPDVFRNYAGLVRDVTEQLNEQRRTNRRLINAFARCMEEE
jgi:hypothetical protein|tara:strand:+ start:392 stop:904 length:513 start_codon:yes stop_codon:yes gene_type:complete